jgi:hypothetical protein
LYEGKKRSPGFKRDGLNEKFIALYIDWLPGLYPTSNIGNIINLKRGRRPYWLWR